MIGLQICLFSDGNGLLSMAVQSELAIFITSTRDAYSYKTQGFDAEIYKRDTSFIQDPGI